MTASAGYYPQDVFPTSFSLSALFGFRSNPQTSWRYEPPSLPKTALGLDTCMLSGTSIACALKVANILQSRPHGIICHPLTYSLEAQPSTQAQMTTICSDPTYNNLQSTQINMAAEMLLLRY